MSISQNFPSEGPNLYLNPAGSKILDPRISFSRASTGTYVDKDGILKSAPINKPRFDHNPTTGESLGLLNEEQRTNNSLYSTQFNTNWTPTNAYTIPNSIQSPDGTFTGTKLIGNSGTIRCRIIRNDAPSTSGKIYSVYAKAAEWQYIAIGPSNGSGVWQMATFNLTTGTFSNLTEYAVFTISNYGIIPVGNGWYKVWIYFTSSDSNFTIMPVFNTGDSVNPAWTGNGTSGIYIWGAQIEVGTYPTSYIPTPATFTSRASSATFYDSSGILQTAGTNVARSDAYFPDSSGVFRSAGLLLEGAATNLALNSESLNSWANNGNAISITANSQVAPDGTTTADVLAQTAVTGASRWLSSTTRTYTAGTTYTMSIWLKRISGTDAQPTINLWVEGAISSSVGSITTSWKRYTVTFTPATTVTNFSGLNIAWNDTGIANNFTFAAWGFQIETGLVATSYIQTTGATATRAADVSSSSAVTRSADVVTLSGTSNINNENGGTLVSLKGQTSSVINETSLTINQTSLSSYKPISEILYYPSVLTSSTIRQMRGNTSYVTNGLLLHLDAGNTASYPGTGTTWTDLSGNGNNGTLVNGPTYSSANDGAIAFDGINDYVNFGNILNIGTNQFSLEYFGSASVMTSDYSKIASKGGFQTGGWRLSHSKNPDNTYSIAFQWGSGSQSSIGTVCLVNTIYHVVVTRNSSNNLQLYVNGQLKDLTISTFDFSTSFDYNLARSPNSEYFKGNIFNYKHYNRGLSASEIQQNFNALRGRYGI